MTLHLMTSLTNLPRFNKILPHAAIALLITVAITIFFVYQQIEARKQLQYSHLTLKAQQLSAWLDTNFSIINNVLMEVEPLTADTCDSEMLFELRSLMFNVAPVVEIGMVNSAGELICTSWQRHHNAIKVNPPPDQYGLRFVGPLNVEYMQQPAFVLARTLRDGSEVNALVRIRWLKNQLKNYASELGFTALIDSDTGNPIVTNGLYSRPKPATHLPIDFDLIIQAYFQNNREQIAVYSPLTTLPKLSIVISDEKSILIDNDELISPTGFLVLFIIWLALTAVGYMLSNYLSDSRHQLKRALKRDEFINYYQPIVAHRDKKIMGVEVLMRWQHPVEGLKSPITFIPEAIATGYLNLMTSQQLAKCYTELKHLIDKDPDFIVTINISACHLLSQQAITEFIRYKTRIPGLVLEVTEDVLIDETNESIQHAFITLTQAGIQIAIDDFGTGYCGLSYLSQLPVTYLKADKSFIAAIGTDGMHTHVLEMIVDLAQKLELTVIAEGVETTEQLDYLTQLKIELHQGWLYSKALPAKVLLEQIEQRGFTLSIPAS